jgi:SAM-dependent methyltransferase
MSVPFDYDSDPDRYRTGMRMAERSGAGVLYARVAELLREAGPVVVLDVGCGEGVLTRHLAADSAMRVIGLDRSATMLSGHPGPAVRSDATCLGVRTASVDAVVALNMLYHLNDPAMALREARRVLVAGGLFVAATVSRYDSPELAPVWRPEPSTFDAEDAPGAVASVFGAVEIERWDGPFVRLPDPAALREYLRVRRLCREDAERAANTVPTPLTITKRGALVIARA